MLHLILLCSCQVRRKLLAVFFIVFLSIFYFIFWNKTGYMISVDGLASRFHISGVHYTWAKNENKNRGEVDK